MKKTIVLLALTILTLAAACQAKDKVFPVPVWLQGGFYVGVDPVLHLTLPTGTGTVTWDAITGKPTTFTPAAHNHLGTYEPILGNPSVNGYVLSSTTAGIRSWTALPTGGSMTYPGAGIPLSTGSAWGTSIVNNSANWNTAFGWGNHAGLYRPVAWVPTFAQITSKPTTLAGFGITDAALATHNHSALYKPLGYVPTWSEILSKPTFATVATTGSFTDLVNVPEFMELAVALPSLPTIGIPVHTQAEINAMNPPPKEGDVVINSTEVAFQIYLGGQWKTIITNK
jgi:hypothetical protein